MPRYLPIAEHGLIGDLHTVALVGTDGTIDWYCCPRFDSPSVFAAILDADDGGLFRISPDSDGWSSTSQQPVDQHLPRHRRGRRLALPGGPVTVSDSSEPHTVHASEPHIGGLGQKLNWLRAGVLGANDGIVSTAGLVVGVAAATPHMGPILTAGVAGLVAGAVSMALGEYVSVSTQRDTERALLVKERRELEEMPEAELEELTAIYLAKGASIETARKLAEELTAHNAFAAHVDAELGLDPNELTSPWHAAFSSAVAFTAGAILPIVAILIPPSGARIPVTFAVVLLALALTGVLSAYLGGARWGPVVIRLVAGGAIAMAVTFGVGQLLGAAGI